MANDSLPVLVVIGGGGIGLAAALRLGRNRHVLLASRSESTIATASAALEKAGIKFSTQQVDVSSYESVAAVARTAAGLGGDVETVILTSAISPAMGGAERIFEVDVRGTANVLDVFGREGVVARGGNVVCVGSMASRMFPALAPELERHLALAPAAEVLENRQLWDLAAGVGGSAYCIAKQANVLRVQAAAASKEYAGRGVRVNIVSPGMTETNMLEKEMENDATGGIRAMIEAMPVPRAGKPEEIAEAIEFVTRCGFVNGIDILVDGGCIAAQRWGRGEGRDVQDKVDDLIGRANGGQ
ncbi:Dehydrogenase/reductase SDR family member 4 [Colletotrichum orbiculare MAFF 240422]|uniref:Dehydrogenase/reductase SDR family member 4 n=1 Tax=Colletotrichum orbiculare (strain 104-T / ATCC 96160 / CBS 514.97 / LARS 414 / MAFF 240422) TaxID=1213857 RepID=N4V639_COLOR|nr:Dehydrogenase/reductase SDR family member 4 [Colletotrichum orbiculare MAFF 240422]